MASNFYAVLKKDHDEQRELTKKFKQAENSSEWKKLFQEIKKDLKPHVKGEEASVFQRLKHSDDREIRLETLEKLQEHDVMERLLEEAQNSDQDSEEFWAKVKVMLEINEHHIDEEEEETFPTMKKQFSEDELDELLNSFNQEKEKVKKEIG
ncbi:Hemerythrin HHE cation binding domain-containing protein [Desulfonatronum thiosulfatophilum]|uniref:Hemerythrin HHE cation binding domain-containing protein n=1 Tax=Desulfonatronum thiosulfatophilum TaxID=617002 RepID=A0A1G6D592_9BACT|nr:hemerythrin domain-containing protein [Desulfonatronum thiosulfatophilum]SDB40322.1 Hemerythrin HHE cation binding domain-containing protein [Desulfonatronum thiosulfatophilum]